METAFFIRSAPWTALETKTTRIRFPVYTLFICLKGGGFIAIIAIYIVQTATRCVQYYRYKRFSQSLSLVPTNQAIFLVVLQLLCGYMSICYILLVQVLLDWYKKPVVIQKPVLRTFSPKYYVQSIIINIAWTMNYSLQ
jgi:hypothetical protein